MDSPELEFSDDSISANLSIEFESDAQILNENSQPDSKAVITVTPTPNPEAVIAPTPVEIARRQDSLYVDDIGKISIPFSIESNR